MSLTLAPEKTIPSTISKKTSNKPNKRIPITVSVSWSTFLFSFISISLLSLSLFFLSFKDTTFWFFLSNAIIFFIAAADSDTISPSKPKPDLYDEYVKNIQSRSTYHNPEPPVSESHRHHDDISEKLTLPETEIMLEKREVACDHVEKKPVKAKYSRNESEKAIVGVGDKRKVLRRSQTTENGGRRWQEGDFSAMSDVDDLNRRVEEFIRRFNREIRLQEMREQMEEQ